MPIRAVGFDYLGVTAHLSGRSVFELVGERLAIDANRVQEAYGQSNGLLQRGTITREQLWHQVAVSLDRTNDVEVILAAEAEDQPHVDTKLLDMVDEVRARGFKTGLLSNLATGTPWDAGLHAQGVDRHFDGIVLSGDIGISKPDIRAYQALAVKLDVSLDELVFIDDRPASMVGIESAGVIPIVYTGVDSLRGHLRRLKVIG